MLVFVYTTRKTNGLEPENHLPNLHELGFHVSFRGCFCPSISLSDQRRLKHNNDTLQSK